MVGLEKLMSSELPVYGDVAGDHMVYSFLIGAEDMVCALIPPWLKGGFNDGGSTS